MNNLQQKSPSLEAIDDETSVNLEREFEEATAQLHRLNEEVEIISRAASHDLATPLRDIHTLCEFINESIEVDDIASIADNVSRIGNRALRLENMLNAVLRYIHASQRSYTKSVVDLEKTIIKQYEKTPNIESFTFNINTTVKEVTTYRSALSIVASQLLENSIKHHDKNRGTIVVSITQPSPDSIEIVFEDDGPGIESAFQNRIFTAFETLKPKDEIEGSGMGLSIAKRLLVNTNGSIAIESPIANERGTRFTVCLPC